MAQVTAGHQPGARGVRGEDHGVSKISSTDDLVSRLWQPGQQPEVRGEQETFE